MMGGTVKGGGVVRGAFIVEALISYLSGAVFVFKPELLMNPYFPPQTALPQTTLLVLFQTNKLNLYSLIHQSKVTQWWGAANLIIAVLLTLGALDSGTAIVA